MKKYILVILLLSLSILAFGESFPGEIVNGELTSYSFNSSKIDLFKIGVDIISIGPKALSNKKCKEISLPFTAVYFKEYCLSDCPNLKYVFFPALTQYIDDTAFYNNRLEKFGIMKMIAYKDPDLIRFGYFYIGWKLGLISELEFNNEMLNRDNNDRLKEVGITPLDTNLGKYNQLTNQILVKYTVIDDVLYTVFEDKLVCYPACKKDNKYEISKKTKELGKVAFANCQYLEELIIPIGVTKIYDTTFEGCENVKFIVVKNSVAHKYCESHNLNFETIDGGSQDLDQSDNAKDDAIDNQEKKTNDINELKDTEKETTEEPVKEAKTIKTESKSNNTSGPSCPDNPFYDNLHSFIDKEGNEISKDRILLENNFIEDSGWLKDLDEDNVDENNYDRIYTVLNSLVQKNAIKNKKITDLWTGPKCSFDALSVVGNKNLKYIKIDPNVEDIDEDAFQDNPNIELFHVCVVMNKVNTKNKNVLTKKYIDIDGVLFKKDESKIQKSGQYLLFYPVAKKDESYVVPDNTERICNSAFRDAKNLKTVTIPKSVTEIGNNAFHGTKITLIVTKNSYGEKFAKSKKMKFEYAK
ncbi:MAG: leucine-rich repeat protein [Abditibacteriota bacterium]|nr:leucine-rich repeat protein [Abditibacteriota bacterium]